MEVQKKEEYRRIPLEITDRTLTGERLRFWIYILASGGVGCEGEEMWRTAWSTSWPPSSANILGATVRELDKLVESTSSPRS